MRVFLLLLIVASSPALAKGPVTCEGVVYEDVNRNGIPEAGEPGLRGVRVSDGQRIATSGANGVYRLPHAAGATVFVIKPAEFDLPRRPDGMPDFWQNVQPGPGPTVRYGGIPQGPAGCRDFALQRRSPSVQAALVPALDVLVFGDPQPKTATDVDYFRRDIVEPLLGKADAALGLTLGDVVNDDLDLLSGVKRATAELRVPWLHAAGNHDIDFDVSRDEDSLLTFRREFGPDTLAWEEAQASFVVFDNVIYRPGQSPAYIGGLREDQFAFLRAYLRTARKDRLLVLAAHIPVFDEPGRETFRAADRKRLFALLAPFPKLLLLTAHGHVQRHYFHGAGDGWRGRTPLHEYNVGAACGSYWSGVTDAAGIPDSTMVDGTPNGYARLRVEANGRYALRWFNARDKTDAAGGADGIGLSLPRVLRRDSYPGYGVFANVYMGHAGSVVEYRVDGGDWKPMARVLRADPRLLAENVADEAATALRAFDRLPEAEASTHLWRGTLPTNLAIGEHRVEVRTQDPWRGELRAEARYRLDDWSGD